jgi:hypothetical protein
MKEAVAYCRVACAKHSDPSAEARRHEQRVRRYTLGGSIRFEGASDRTRTSFLMTSDAQLQMMNLGRYGSRLPAPGSRLPDGSDYLASAGKVMAAYWQRSLDPLRG